MSLRRLSVVFPVYNESGNILRFIRESSAALSVICPGFELIIVDDGSSDSSGDICFKLSQEHNNIVFARHNKNLGYGAAFRSGLQLCSGEWTLFCDSDGQFDLKEISKLMPYMNDHDIVSGYRLTRKDSLIRVFIGWFWRLIVRILLGIRCRDVNCGFKLFRTEKIRGLPLSCCSGAISAELFFYSAKRGLKVKEIAVKHAKRTSGRPTGASVKVVLRSFYELGGLFFGALGLSQKAGKI